MQGVDKDGVEIYYGIPYGAEPAGELRWKEATAPEAWEEVRDCTQREPIALQLGTVYNDDGSRTTALTGSTDCLNLDIYTTAEAEGLPVLVYVHGGNNQTGSSFEVVGNDITVTDNCVYVALNYRTGLLGFIALPALVNQETSGNFGLLDIAAALRWVRDNIASFGGDPANVTVSGFSAGGRDVMAMLLSPAFEGLFDKAIAFSGGMTICDLEDAAWKDAEFLSAKMRPLNGWCRIPTRFGSTCTASRPSVWPAWWATPASAWRSSPTSSETASCCPWTALTAANM